MIARYGVAVVSVTAALVSSRMLEIYLVAAPASLFLCAVMFSTWFGGLKPGLLATALSILAFKYYFAAPVYSLALDIKEIPSFLIFALSGLFVGLLALQRAAELERANEALRGCLDALASVRELDDFLGELMATMTRQLGAVSSTLRVRNFEENTLQLEFVFQSGRVMTPDEAKYPECWQSVTLEQFDHNFLYHSAGKRTENDSGFTYVERASELAQHGLAEARRSAFSLQPTVTEESGLIEALQKLVERSNIPGSLRCNFCSRGIPEESLPPSAQQELLRIAQEAISNAVRHAKPTVISVDVRWEPPNIVLEVADDGSGIAHPQLAGGSSFGLSNMRARAKKLGAQFDVRTAASRGTSIVVLLPINR